MVHTAIIAIQASEIEMFGGKVPQRMEFSEFSQWRLEALGRRPKALGRVSKAVLLNLLGPLDEL